ncbi:hypothetical protein EB052_01175, partial [bacterium]|nr:hypothetical protein [bacterium]
MYTGFSAQNVQANIPEAVMTDKRGYLTLNDRPITAALVNAVKDLNSQLNTLRQQVASLQNSSPTISAPAAVSTSTTVTAKMLCLDDVCVTKEQLQTLLLRTGVASANSSVTVQNGGTVIQNVPSSAGASVTVSSSSVQSVDATTTVSTSAPTAATS